jgi:hypothetical protein
MRLKNINFQIKDTIRAPASLALARHAPSRQARGSLAAIVVEFVRSDPSTRVGRRARTRASRRARRSAARCRGASGTTRMVDAAVGAIPGLHGNASQPLLSGSARLFGRMGAIESHAHHSAGHLRLHRRRNDRASHPARAPQVVAAHGPSGQDAGGGARVLASPQKGTARGDDVN